MIATVNGVVKWVGERVSKKGKKYFTLMLIQGADRSNPVFVNSNKEFTEGEKVSLDCEITQNGEYLNVYAI